MLYILIPFSWGEERSDYARRAHASTVHFEQETQMNIQNRVAAMQFPAIPVYARLLSIPALTLLVMAILFAMQLTASAQTWQTLLNPPPVPEIIDPQYNYDLGPGGASNPILLTDGSVIIQNANPFGAADGEIFKLTPDINGSYINGTWTQLATMPYVEAAPSQAVLPNGEVLIEGGEFSGYEEYFTLTNQGAIYDPVTDIWTSVPPPPFFVDLYPPRAAFAPNPIGDAPNVVLPNGAFMIGDKMSRQAALFDLATFSWTETGTNTKSDMNDEEGWTLLPSGEVLTVDCYTDYYFGVVPPPYPSNPTNSEIYNPATDSWSSAGSTIHTLTDPYLSETGPGVLRPDGTVFAVGSEGYTSIYHAIQKNWSVGPKLPISPQGYQYTAQDAPGALLPDGNVLFAVSGGYDQPGYYSAPPVAFFEFNGKKLIAEPTIPNAANDVSGSISLLLLPTGQVLATDSTQDVEIYTPSTFKHSTSWEPLISQAPTTVQPGGSYIVHGLRLNGMSQASMFGDEEQNATNYPLVRITNMKTKHVFYSRTHDHSSMAVASNAVASTHFDVPYNQETGRSELQVVANGIASAPVIVNVEP